MGEYEERALVEMVRALSDQHSWEMAIATLVAVTDEDTLSVGEVRMAVAQVLKEDAEAKQGEDA